MINQINIKNYKLFKNFKIEGFDRVNLITGANNIGKTALMEAIYISTYSKTIDNFLKVLENVYYFRYHKKDVKNILEYFNNISIDNIELSTKIENLTAKVELKFKNKNLKENQNNISLKPIVNQKVNFIETTFFNDKILQDYYGYVQNKDKENFLDEILNRFDSNIEKFKFIKDIPMIKYTGIDEYIHINELGDGIKRVLFFITALFKSENGYLFIDEIENGIWYKNIDLLWEVIFGLSKELNVQVFATTHSSDVIKSFSKFDGKLFEFGCNKNNKVDYIDYSHSFLLEELENNREVRGWE